MKVDKEILAFTSQPLHVGIAAPIATTDVADLLSVALDDLPRGYAGAPLIATLIRELLERGHTVSAFTLSSDMPLTAQATRTVDGRAKFRLTYCPMRPKAWPMNGLRLGRIVDLFAFERGVLARAIAAAAPDVVHAHWAYEFSLAAMRTGLPHVVTCHDSPERVASFETDFRHGAYRRLRAVMARRVLQRAGVVTTVSPYMVEQIRPLCGASAQVVPNPIPNGLLERPMPAHTGWRIGMVGNGFQSRKNPQAALQAFAQIAERFPDAELHAFGHGFGPGQAAQQWWDASALRGRIVFRGAMTHEALLDEMAQCRVLMHPALEESFGAVLTEAMALGVPVVAGHDSGAVPWVVGDAGRLVDVTKPSAIAEAVVELLSDTSQWRSLSALSRERVASRFTARAVVDAYEQAYARALALSRPMVSKAQR